MLGCWEIEPANRPNFESLSSDLVASLASMSDYLMLEQDMEISVTATGNGNSPRYNPYTMVHLEENTSRPASYVDPNSMPCSDNETEDGFVTPEPNQTGMTAQRWGDRGGEVVGVDQEGERGESPD